MRASKNKQHFLRENEELRTRLEEAEETLRAIRAGEVDALVVSGPEGDQLYTLKGADYSYRILLETMEEGAATLAGDGTILYCNNRLAAMLGAPLNKVIGSSLQEYLFPSQANTLQKILREGDGIRGREESYLNRADGAQIPVLLSFGSLQIADVRGFCLTVTDLTAQKRVEEELRKAQDELEKRVQKRTEDLVITNRALQSEIAERRKAEQALRDSEARANALVKYAPTGIYEMDYRGPSFLSVNDAMCHILGYTREELFSMDPSALLDDDSRARFGDRVRRQLAGREIDETVEYRVRKKDGSLIHAILNVSLNGQGKEPYRALVVAYDITERKRMEEELRKSRDELEIRVRERTAELTRAYQELQAEIVRREKAEQQLRQAQKMEAVGTLTGGIAHDLNNILAPIVINSELALMDLPGGSAVRENLDLILKSGNRGKDLVKQLLLFSRKSEKKQEMVTLTPIIKETFKLMRASIPVTIQMNLHLETESDAVYADPSQIQQVIMNLCTNAAYAMRGTTGSIDISLQSILFGSNDMPEPDMEPGEYLVLSVKDSGQGMDKEVTNRLFEPFFTTKPAGEGTGLGLSVAYGIVKNHRGNITAYSEPGKGSIFKVYLPKADTGTADKAEILKPIPGGKERILFVDDEEFIVYSVKNMLQRLGYQVTALTDSREALRLFSADPSQFDLVMTDQTMPFLTGESLGAEMLRIRDDVPVILCTGYSDFISSERAAKMGFRAFVMKPFTIREGAELVRRVLDQNRPKESPNVS